MRIQHPTKGFSGMSFGLAFRDGTATTANTALAKRMRALGFSVQEDGPEDKQDKKGAQGQKQEV